MSEKQIKAKKKEKSKGKTMDKPVKSKREMTDKLVKIDQKLIVPEKCTLTKTSLILDESISDEDYLKVGKFLTKVKKSLMWWIGDWCVFGDSEKFWGTGVIQAIRSHYSDKTIYNAALVCKKIEPSRRREKLEFGHHEAVASLEPEEQDHWLERAEKERLSVMKLRRLIKREKLLAEAKKEYEQEAIVTDNWGKSFYYLDYIHRCIKAMSEAENMVAVLCSWRDQYSFDFYSDNNHEVIAFLEKANKLLKPLKDLLGRGVNDDEDDIEEPKDEPKIEEVKKEEVAPEDIENLFDD